MFLGQPSSKTCFFAGSTSSSEAETDAKIGATTAGAAPNGHLAVPQSMTDSKGGPSRALKVSALRGFWSNQDPAAALAASSEEHETEGGPAIRGFWRKGEPSATLRAAEPALEDSESANVASARGFWNSQVEKQGTQEAGPEELASKLRASGERKPPAARSIWARLVEASKQKEVKINSTRPVQEPTAFSSQGEWAERFDALKEVCCLPSVAVAPPTTVWTQTCHSKIASIECASQDLSNDAPPPRFNLLSPGKLTLLVSPA